MLAGTWPACSPAQTVVIDTEPNDTPQSAMPVRAPATIMGEMGNGDQDAYTWTISDEDAGRRWNLALDGIPGVLTIVDIVRVSVDDNGAVAATRRLLKLASRDGLRTARLSGLMFEPGDYLLGLAHSGRGGGYRPHAGSLSFGNADATRSDTGAASGDAYRVYLEAGPKLAFGTREAAARQADARAVRSEQELTGMLGNGNSAWYRLEFADDSTASRWDIRVQVPVGRTADAALTGADGRKLATARTGNDGTLVLPDLALPIGTYYVEVTAPSGSDDTTDYPHTLVLTAAGQRVAGSEAEPNGRWEQANRIASDCCSGYIGESGDLDLYAFTVGEQQADTLQDIVLEAGPEAVLELCLLDAMGQPVQCRNRGGGVTLGALLLSPGDYGVSVRGRAGVPAGTAYALNFRNAGVPDPAQETEPNDTLAYASGTPDRLRVRGSFDSKDDVDFYRFVIAGKAELWRVQAIGDHIGKVEYHDVSGQQKQRLAATRNQQRVTLDNLFLLPGTHYFSVTGNGAGDYTLLARSLGPPDPNGELEPNDDTSRMQLLRIGQTRTGLLGDPADTDLYRFYLAGWDHVVLTATPPADGRLDAEITYNGRQSLRKARDGDGAIVLDGIFPPGDYQLKLTAGKTSDAEYRVTLARGDRHACTADCEPNDSAAFANPVPASHVIAGHAGEWADVDWFVLPTFANDTEVSFAVVADTDPDLRLYDAAVSEIRMTKDRADGYTYRGTVPGGTRAYIRVGRSNRAFAYTLQLLVGNETATPAALPDLPVALALTFDSDTVAAYERVGQRLAGRLVASNTGSEPFTLSFAGSTSDERWHVGVADDATELQPGARASLDVDVLAAPDAWAGIPVRIGIVGASPDGRRASTYADIAVGRDALPVSPVHAFSVPAALQGGLDVARSQFGATAVAVPPASNNPEFYLQQLFDGRAAISQGPEFGTRRGQREVITVNLAGDAPAPVVGFALNPLSRDYAMRTPRDVEFQLSIDGTEFATVLNGTLTTVGRDQYYVLDAPVAARHARLLLDTNWFGQTDGPLTLGEWKVIASPGYDPFAGKGANLADVELGGHVVWANPRLSADWDSAILTAKRENPAARVPADEALEWVLAFHDNRAAQITGIEWVPSARTSIDIERLSVSASLESPAGPWRPLADWDRATSGDRLRLDAPAWVRYLRFSVAAADSSRVMNIPETLRVFERPTGAEYRSALGEWGFRSQAAWYEATQPLPTRPSLATRGNEARAGAAALSPGGIESGLVQLGKQTQWYRPAVPGGHNTLTFTLRGDPTVRTALQLTGASGEPLPLRKLERRSTPRMHVFEAAIAADADTYLEVREPQRNVMFVWDTSASTLPYQPMIYNSLIAYAEDLVPDRDTANLMPFGRRTPMLREWYGEPYLMQMILNDYPRRETSSAAEQALLYATHSLANRPGTKAIVVVTDAATSRHEPMWDAFREVQPRIFSLKVTSGESSPLPAEQEQDLMQDWASVNGGHYAYLAHEGDMEVAFDRAATLLRRPAAYTLEMSSEFRVDPGPGTLSVMAGNAANRASSAAVELILDASGSMLKRLQGRRRIDIAKDVLTAAVREQIPAGTPTALRIFGHRTPNACDTKLEIALQPLDADSAAAKLSQVQAMNLARTPIADSLAAVPADLRGTQGPALVVLVTDGEETCDGSPGDVIAALRESGFAINLNIVGFAIDDQALSDQFRGWARAGGGRYFAADDADDLSDAVAQALAAPYSVNDAAGNEVAQGIVGAGPVELDAGVYTVTVATTPQQRFDGVEVAGGANVELTLQR